MNTNNQQPALAPGDLDPDFGENGVVFTSFGPETIDAAALGINIAPDGKLLISGYRGTNDYALVRLNIDGTPDQSFGNAGVIVGQFKPGLESAIAAAFVTSDQKLVLVGKVYATDAGDTDYRAVTRLNSDGSLDTSFGDQGSVILDLPLDKAASVSYRFARPPETLEHSSSQVNALLQADGKIVVNDTFVDVAVTFRLTPDGALDTSFNGTGYVTQSFPGARTWLGPLYVENDKIITAGSYSMASDIRPLVIRYNADGSLDSSFGENGVFIAPPESTDSHSSRLLDALRETNGNILGIGSTTVYPLKALVMGFDKDGSIDPAFNGGKALLTDIGLQGCQWNNAILDSSSGLNVVCGNTLGSDLAVIVGRIDDRGVWDTRFGNSQGWVKVVPGTGYTTNYDVAVQNDSNILVVGAFFQSTGFMKGFVLRILG